MQIEIENLEEITVVPEKFKNEENPPKFIFKTPNAADVIDFQIFNDITRVANRCFVRFENKPLLLNITLMRNLSGLAQAV